ncbi:Type I restriction-modification system specificity subunit S [Anoxybacillus flavithermus]|uniref:restriction endonuclease subunit S n=1 Tax=Anoxybacillus flavithermus TaxID=33934 RepID=UPI0007D9FF5E|nr:restriction endonuclease subunit S [Anoxybacillus flavithermus]OAO77801.1 Type I restriction-modification system specificity subunit S [Anoxybacillus flavithermus]
MNVKKYHSLKESGVEWIEKIPTHWELRRIGQLFKFRNEKVSDEEYMPLSVTKDGVVPQLENVAKTIHNENRKKVLKGDIVINSRSDRRGSSGLSMLNGSCSLINHVLEPRVELEGKYIHYLFKSVPFCDEYYRWGTGIVDDLWSTQKDRMSQIQIPFPPINEQKRIARFLDDKTNAIAKLKKILEEKINKLKDYRSSLITQAVTKGLDPNVPMKDSGIEWLGEVPGHWEKSKLKYLAQIGPSKSEVSKLTNVKVSFLPMEKIGQNKLILDVEKDISEVYSGYTYFKDGDVVVAKVTPCFENGNIAVARNLVNGIGFGTSEIYVLRPYLSKMIPEFLSYLFQSEPFRSKAISSMYGVGGLKRIPSEFFESYEFYIPSVTEQKLIVNSLDRKIKLVNHLISKINEILNKLDTYRSSLITAAVTGQIDVSDWKEAEEELETIL